MVKLGTPPPTAGGSSSGGARLWDDIASLAALKSSVVHAYDFAETLADTQTVSDRAGSADIAVIGSDWRGVPGPAYTAGLAGDAGKWAAINDVPSTVKFIGAEGVASDFGAGDFALLFWVHPYIDTVGGWLSLSSTAQTTYFMVSQKTTFPSFRAQRSTSETAGVDLGQGQWSLCLVQRDQSESEVQLGVNGMFIRPVDSLVFSNEDYSSHGFYLGRNSNGADNSSIRSPLSQPLALNTLITASQFADIWNDGDGSFY